MLKKKDNQTSFVDTDYICERLFRELVTPLMSDECFADIYDPNNGITLDPILNEYLDGDVGMGGVYNSKNLGLYTYTHNNPVILVDPDGNRAMMPGEVRMAKTYFGNSIFYKNVNIEGNFRGRSTTFAPLNLITMGTYEDDFSKASDAQKAEFMHEMTHIWQSRFGLVESIINIIGAAIEQFGTTIMDLFGGGNNDALYEIPEDASSFGELTSEQQGQAVQSSYRGILNQEKARPITEKQERARELVPGREGIRKAEKE